MTVVLLLVLIQIPSALGQAVNPYRRTLKGLKKLHAVIEKLDFETQGTELSHEQLKTDVELRLRLARVPVVDSSLAFLYVQVDALRLPKGWASVTVGLNEAVTLDRDRSIGCSAQTWGAATIGTASDREFASAVRKSVEDSVDSFINDYLAANRLARDVAPEKPS